MKIILEKLIMHHFLSFGDAEIELQDRKYCVVKGINNNPKDAAISNGSGKSSWLSAICWALTGETIQGLTSNIPNIYYNDGCYVTLHFRVDNDKYKITRYKNYAKIGTDLKIIINDEDKSGKGIRESENILAQYLPDITSQLIGSVIILGQGLPKKFTNNSPSGRKEVLEKLSKSDFMIEDIKNRISKRSTELNTELRSYQDNDLKLNTEKSMLSKNKSDTEIELKKLSESSNIDFDKLINDYESDINKITIRINEKKKEIENQQELINKLNESLSIKDKEKSEKQNNITQAHNTNQKELMEERSKLKSDRAVLEAEIKRLESIKDICPTCHQKIPNVVKQDTSAQHAKIAQIDEIISVNTVDMNSELTAYNQACRVLQEEYNNSTKEIRDQIKNINDIITRLNTADEDSISKLNSEYTKVSTLLNKTKLDKTYYLQNKDNLQNKLNNIIQEISLIDNKILYNNKNKLTVEEHIDVVNKMNTLVKRDFRGFLLSNVINFIDNKAKEYSKSIFDTNELDFKLEGNNINIEFCKKSYESLSGGEKQRVDLILQFALRDMLCQYLNFSSNIIALDEITDALDSLACEKILDFISKQLTDVDSIFIISHRADELEIPCDTEIVVEKDANGISRIK